MDASNVVLWIVTWCHVIQLTNQVPIEFGDRLHPLGRSSRLLASSTSASSSSAADSSHHGDDLLEEQSSHQSSHSLLTGDPITVNKSEGMCGFDGRVYRSGENIARKHDCHFCFCRSGYIDCYWKNCPPAPEGCQELNYEGVCDRSLYLCPIWKKTKVPFSVKRSSRQVSSTSHGNYTSLGCDILGVHYRVGELVGVATDPCLECRCALDALYCSPKCCFQPVDPVEDDHDLQKSRADPRPHQSHPLQHLRSDFADGIRRR